MKAFFTGFCGYGNTSEEYTKMCEETSDHKISEPISDHQTNVDN